jgi:hypothetical protein
VRVDGSASVIVNRICRFNIIDIMHRISDKYEKYAGVLSRTTTVVQTYCTSRATGHCATTAICTHVDPGSRDNRGSRTPNALAV